jgi:hypothetical protein
MSKRQHKCLLSPLSSQRRAAERGRSYGLKVCSRHWWPGRCEGPRDCGHSCTRKSGQRRSIAAWSNLSRSSTMSARHPRSWRRLPSAVTCCRAGKLIDAQLTTERIGDFVDRRTAGQSVRLRRICALQCWWLIPPSSEQLVRPIGCWIEEQDESTTR